MAMLAVAAAEGLWEGFAGRGGGVGVKYRKKRRDLTAGGTDLVATSSDVPTVCEVLPTTAPRLAAASSPTRPKASYSHAPLAPYRPVINTLFRTGSGEGK